MDLLVIVDMYIIWLYYFQQGIIGNTKFHEIINQCEFGVFYSQANRFSPINQSTLSRRFSLYCCFMLFHCIVCLCLKITKNDHPLRAYFDPKIILNQSRKKCSNVEAVFLSFVVFTLFNLLYLSHRTIMISQEMMITKAKAAKEQKLGILVSWCTPQFIHSYPMGSQVLTQL